MDLYEPTVPFLSTALWSEGIQLQLIFSAIILTFGITTQPNEYRLICSTSEQLLRLSFMMNAANSHLPRDCRDQETSLNPTTAAIVAQPPAMQQEKGLNTPPHKAEPTPSENVDFDGDHRFLVCNSLQETEGSDESSLRSDFYRTCF